MMLLKCMETNRHKRIITENETGRYGVRARAQIHYFAHAKHTQKRIVAAADK